MSYRPSYRRTVRATTIGGIMRAIHESSYDDRAAHYVRKGRRQVLTWVVFGLLIVAFMVGGIVRVAEAHPVDVARGGRTGVGTMPRTTQAWPVFREAMEQLMNRTVHVRLYQNCNRDKCAVYSYYARYTATFAKVRGVWRLRTVTMPDVSTLPLTAPIVTAS